MRSPLRSRWQVGALVVLLALALLSPLPARAQGEGEQPVVYALLLYSPSCPHCHDFIENSYPRMREEFGDQFQLLFINVQSEQGYAIAQAAYDAYGVPEGERYVPMMMIGDEILVGSVEIPERGTQIVREGLQSGGIPLPPVPGLQEAYNAALAQATQQASPAEVAEVPGQPSADSAQPAESAPLGTGAETGNLTVGARLARDPLANALAIGVLLGLTASFAAVVSAGVGAQRGRGWLEGRARWLVALIVALAGLGIAVTLVLRASESTLALLLAGLVVALLLVAVAVLFTRRNGALPEWLIAVVALAGLAAAVYLAYVEVGQQEAVCGAVGDCNTVQQSPYAMLFGALPIGVLGVAGYVLILAASAVTQLAQGRAADLAHAALLAMTLFGVAFSIYLTFLEPFVIGATCAWCLTSALTLLLLLWLEAPAGWRAVRRLRG